MCGLFGFVGRDMSAIKLLRMAVEAGRRGPHAWGVSWYDDTSINSYKDTGQLTVDAGTPLTDHVPIKSVHTLIGQTRLNTSGDWRNPNNNQPIVVGHVAIAHNGNVYNVDKLAQLYGIDLQTENDSEVIAHLISRSAQGSLLLQVIHAVEVIDACSPLALLVLFPQGVITVRRGHPLYVLTQDAEHYFCSRPFHPEATMLPDNAATFWTTTPGFNPSLSLYGEVVL